MAQVTQGLRAILSHPFIYAAFQSFMGANSFRSFFIENYVKPSIGMNILDIGCGPADILAFLPEVNYWGYDISGAYIHEANKNSVCVGGFTASNFNLKI